MVGIEQAAEMSSAAFVVVVRPPSSRSDEAAARSVGGLPLPLRVVLAAQDAGASAVHLAEPAGALAPRLRDARVRIPIRDGPPPGDAITIEVPADVVFPPSALGALRDAVADGRARYLGEGAARIEARPAHEARASLGPPVPLVFAPPFAFPPLHVATRRDARRAMSALLRACRKPTDGWTSTYLNRYVSLSLSRLLVHTPIRPNHLSVAILFVGVASGVIAARGTHTAFVIGAALLQAQSVLDGCDGELARLTHRRSKTGEWLDTVGDDLSNYAFFAGAAFGLERSTGERAYLALGALIVGCGGLASAIEYRYLARVGSGDLLVYPVLEGGRWGDASAGRAPLAGRIAVALQPLFKRDTFVLLTFVSAVLGILGPMIALSAIGAVAVLIAVLRTEARLARERQAGG